MEFLDALNDSSFVIFLRESLWTYPLLLAVHAIGMAFIVGVNAAIDLRVLGFASAVPIAPMEKFFPVMWVGFWINALSGLVLLSAFAAKNLSDPVFWTKIVLIVAAGVNLRLLQRFVFRRPENELSTPPAKNVRLLAATSLFFWIAAVVTGRLMAYSWYRFWE
jgi:hypothetical protein